MLVLSRKHGETIRIGNNVEIVVTQISPGKIRLGVAAPRHVVIRRGELKDQDHKAASSSERQ